MLKYYNPIEPKVRPAQPELVTLYGDDNVNGLEILSPDDYDYLLGNDLSIDDIKYYMNEYPELMGFWAKLVKGVLKVGKKGVQAIGKGVRRKRRRKKRKRAEKRERLRMEQERTAAAQRAIHRAVIVRQAQEKKKKSNLITLGTVAAAALLLLG